ncbi:hypothetical protein KM043_003558 [Ampulex compressa]|nr:hypothetical protein KM043_003558 [Ampulex compressa]
MLDPAAAQNPKECLANKANTAQRPDTVCGAYCPENNRICNRYREGLDPGGLPWAPRQDSWPRQSRIEEEFDGADVALRASARLPRESLLKRNLDLVDISLLDARALDWLAGKFVVRLVC